MSEHSWFKKFMGMPDIEQSNKRRWVEIATWIGIAALLVTLAVVLIGCSEYDRSKRKCQTSCEKIQENNVGARFMWIDLDRTFGKCTCYSKDGSIRQLFIKTRR